MHFLNEAPDPRNEKVGEVSHTRGITCSWYSIPMLKVLMRMAIIIPRLKYLLSTMRINLSRKFSQYCASRLLSSSTLWWVERPGLNSAPWENSYTTSPSDLEQSESPSSRSMVSRALAQYGQLKSSKSSGLGTTPAICNRTRLWPAQRKTQSANSQFY